MGQDSSWHSGVLSALLPSAFFPHQCLHSVGWELPPALKSPKTREPFCLFQWKEPPGANPTTSAGRCTTPRRA